MKKGKIFNGQEVQAILKGNKTMFREVIKEDGNQTETQHSFDEIKCPYQVGQKIFVKENFWVNIKEIRVERLADISEEDAIAEGVIYPNTPVCCHRYQTHCCGNYEAEDASWEFKQIWNTTHEKPEEKWEADPWVFVYSFEVVK